MSFAWSHTTYAEYNGMIFNFESKQDLNYFLAHAENARRISATDAWKAYHETKRDFIRVNASCTLGANPERKKRIQEWEKGRRRNAYQ